MMHDKKYLLTEATTRIGPSGVHAYRNNNEKHIGYFNWVLEDMTQERKTNAPFANFLGHLTSAYFHFHEQAPPLSDEHSKILANQSMTDEERELLSWCFMMEARHPSTMVVPHYRACIDFIYYTHGALVVNQLLEMPDKAVQLQEYNALPNTVLPSDHMSIHAKFDWHVPQKTSALN